MSRVAELSWIEIASPLWSRSDPCRESQNSRGLKFCTLKFAIQVVSRESQNSRGLKWNFVLCIRNWTQSRVAGLLWIEICQGSSKALRVLVESRRSLADIAIQQKKYISIDVFSLWYVKQCINLGGASPLWGLQRNRQLLAVNLADIWRERYITLSRKVLSAKIRDTLVVSTNGKKHSK